MIRIRAALIHLGICLVIATSLLAVVFGLWYPTPLWHLLGLEHILIILLSIDVTIGPIITLIIYNPGKGMGKLKRDLIIIATCQLSALAYGAYTVYIARPVAIVFNKDRFDVVTALDIDTDSLKVAAKAKPPVLTDLPMWGPKWFFAELPADPEQRQKILFAAVSGGHDLPQRPEFYRPFDENLPAFRQHIRPLSELKKLNPLVTPEIWRERIGYDEAAEKNLGYVPVRAQFYDAVVLVDQATGKRLGITLLQPW